jgi:hypothetical protein
MVVCMLGSVSQWIFIICFLWIGTAPLPAWFSWYNDQTMGWTTENQKFDFTQEQGFSPSELGSAGSLRSECWWEITTIRCVMTHQSVGLSYVAEDAWNHGYSTFQDTQTYSQAHLAPYSNVCLFFSVGVPRQATDVLQPTGLLYLPLWTFQLWPPDAPAPTDAFLTLAAEFGTYAREDKDREFCLMPTSTVR